MPNLSGLFGIYQIKRQQLLIEKCYSSIVRLKNGEYTFLQLYSKSVKNVSNVGKFVILNATGLCALDVKSQKPFNFFISESRHRVFENGWAIGLTPKKILRLCKIYLKHILKRRILPAFPWWWTNLLCSFGLQFLCSLIYSKHKLIYKHL